MEGKDMFHMEEQAKDDFSSENASEHPVGVTSLEDQKKTVFLCSVLFCYFVVIVVAAAVLGTESKSSATKLYPRPVHTCVSVCTYTRAPHRFQLRILRAVL